MSRSALTFACLALCLSSPLRAQERADQESKDSANVVVLDHDFTGVYEFVRVFLQDGQVYRAELSSTDVTLDIRGLPGRPTRPARIFPFLGSDSPSGTSVVEIYPQEDAEYEIRPIAVAGGGVVTRLRLYRDMRASRRRQYVLDNPGWEVGLELAGGWHSGYPQSRTALPLGSADPSAGTDVETCFSARSAPGMHRVTWCVVGLGYQTQPAARSILWIYTEPRLAIFGHAHHGQSNWEMGALLRFGVGMISESAKSPTILGPGIYVARHILSNSRGAGWSFQMAYSRAFYRGFAKAGGGGDLIIPKSHRLSFGVGWYQ